MKRRGGNGGRVFAGTMILAWIGTAFGLWTGAIPVDVVAVSRAYGLVPNPFLLSAILWIAISAFLAIEIFIPVGPTYGEMLSELLGWLNLDTGPVDPEDHRDPDREIAHWHAAILTAIIAILITGLCTEFIGPVGTSAHAATIHPAIH